MDGGDLYTEEREGMARKCLPVEDLDEHLYIHPGSVVVAAFTVGFEESGFETRYYVGAQDFMEVQRERDNFRRALSLLNAYVQCEVPSIPMNPRVRMEHVLQEAGFTAGDAEATRRLIDWATKGADGG